MRAASKGASLAGAMLLVGGAAAWALLRPTPAVPMAPEPQVIASDAVAAAPVAAPVAEPVVPPAELAAVAVATIDDGDAAGVAVASAKPAAPTDTAVPNRLSLSVDELVHAGLAQDVAEDLVESLNSMALTCERPPFSYFLLRHPSTPLQIALAVAPLLAQSLKDGGVTVSRTDTIHAPVGSFSGAMCCRDGLMFPLGARRSGLDIVVRERAVPTELWQRYVAEHASVHGWGSIDTALAPRAQGR
jgi:hypothetical protein